MKPIHILNGIALIALAGGIWHVWRTQQSNTQMALEALQELHGHVNYTNSQTEASQTDSGSCNESGCTSGCTSWSNVRKELRDSVVQVICHIAQFNWLEPYKTPEQGQAFGSAFFINESGELITNAHVVNQARSVFIQVPSQGKRRFEVDVICICMDRDLALLKLKPDSYEQLIASAGEISILQFGDSDQIRGSEELMTLGYPLGQYSLKCTTGIVSGREHVDGHYMIQISAPINPGNSGGPSINRSGEVIGVNTSQIRPAQNVNYIIPSNEVLLFLKQLEHAKALLPSNPTKLLRKGFFGIIHDTASEELTKFLNNPAPGGYYVVDVCAGSLVDRAGLKPQDMIYSVNGNPIDIFGELSVPWSEDKVALDDYISRLSFGEKVNISGYRAGKKFDINFTFEPAKLLPVRYMYPGYEPIDYEVFGGMVFMDLSLNLVHALLPAAPQLIKYGDTKEQMKPSIIITHIMADSIALRSRIITRPGVVVDELNGTKVRTLTELRAALQKSLTTDVVTIKTTEGQFAVYPFAKMLAEEEKLSNSYYYPISSTIRNLKKEYETSKSGGALSSAITRPQASIVPTTSTTLKENAKEHKATT